MTLLVSFAVAIVALAASVFVVGCLIGGLARLDRAYPNAITIIVGGVFLLLILALATLALHSTIYGCNDPGQPAWLSAYCKETP